MRRQLDFGLEERHLKRFRSNFGLPSPPIPADLLPLHNRSRCNSNLTPAGATEGDMKAQRQHANIIGSLPLKILGMRRQVTFPYPFEALSSSEVLVMTLEGGFTLNQLLKARSKLQEAKQCAVDTANIRAYRGSAKAEKCRHPSHDDEAAFPSPAATKIIEVRTLGQWLATSVS